jgi:peptide/nickel transport system substrate-binding protein
MTSSIRLGFVALVLAVALAACAGSGAQPGNPKTGTSPVPESAPFKRATAAIKFDPPTLNTKLNPATVAGVDNVEELVNAGVVRLDDRGGLLPLLATAVPSLDNGQWRLLPDGRMETTWKLRPDAAWHDGAPVTSADLAFTLTVGRDPDLAVFRDRVFELIESVDAPDAATLTVTWKSPFINADALFSGGGQKLAMPLPSHLLQGPYTTDKATFLDLPYWSYEYVGAGPYRLRDWVAGSHLVLVANDRFVLGRPKIDEIEVRFVPDPTTLVANVLAGAIDFSLGRGISLEQAIQARRQWQVGHVELGYAKSWIVINPQFVNANPRVVTDARFRKALMYAIDRQQLVETLEFGLTQTVQSILDPDQPQYQELERRQTVRYGYEPQRAAQLLTDLGYARDADGGLRDAAGQPLTLEFRTITTDIDQKSMFAVTDFWRQVGVGVDPVVIPTQRATDLEYRATYPAFELLRQPNDLRGMVRIHSSEARLPEKRYTGTNNPRYQSPELDRLLDQYLTTIPRDERLEVIGQVIHHISDQLPYMGLFYDTEPTLVNNRVLGVGPSRGDATQIWNVMDWDIRQP